MSNTGISLVYLFRPAVVMFNCLYLANKDVPTVPSRNSTGNWPRLAQATKGRITALAQVVKLKEEKDIACDSWGSRHNNMRLPLGTTIVSPVLVRGSLISSL